jgi:hypothetical protein
VDPSNVEDVLSWNVPMSVGDIWSFLALNGYYRRFIKGFSKISKPMTDCSRRIRCLSGRLLAKLVSKS